MAQVPQVKRLLIEDFPDQADWIGPLLQNLNIFIEEVTASLNKSLTLTDNLRATVRELDVVGGSYPVSFRQTFPGKCLGLWVVNAFENTASPAVLTSAVWADWEQKDNNLIINNLSGLTGGTKYKITVVAIGG